MSFSCELQQMRGHVFNFFRRGKFTKQNPVPQDVQHSLIDLLKLGFVHTGESYGFRPAPAAAIRIKMLGIKPGLNGYGGDWERCTKTQEITRDKNGKNGKYTVTERVRGWTDEDEIGLFVQVGAILRGESEITWGEPLYLSGVVTRNSPLWVSNPKQQIAYLGVKYWARLYCPEVILGVYSPDEVEQREEREINPAPVQRMSVQEITSEVSTRTSAQESAANVDAVADDLRKRIDTASSVDQAKAIRADIESQKALLGTALFTELKNKAVKRYYQVDAQNKVEAVINSIPNPGEPEAAEMFAKAESTLGAAKRHLGDELHDKYRITLDDMKPEYIG